MSIQITLTKSLRLFAPVMVAVLMLSLTLVSLANAGARARPLQSYGTDPQLRGLTVIADGGVIVSDTQPNAAPSSGSKEVYFSDYTSGVITVTPDVTGTEPLTVVRGIGLDGTPSLVVSSTTAPLNLPMGDGPIVMAGSQDVTFTLQNNLGESTVFTLSFQEDKFTPTVNFNAPDAGQILTMSAQPAFTVVVAATDPNAPEASGIQSVQVITGAGGVLQTGVTTDSLQWTYDWLLPAEDNVAHTLLVTATDYVGNYATYTRQITVDTVAPTTTGQSITSNLVTNTWYPTVTASMTWTNVFSGATRYYYLWDQTPNTHVTLGTLGRTPTTATTAQTNLPINSDGDYYFHVSAVDGNGNRSSTVHSGPYQIDTVSPTITLAQPMAGNTLTGTQVVISGTASDSTSGVSQVLVTTDTVNWVSAGTTSPWFYTWTLPAGIDFADYTLTARSTDNAGNSRYTAPTTVKVDTVAPTATRPSAVGAPWSSTSTLVFTWTASSDGAGIAGYYVTVLSSTGDITLTTAFVPHSQTVYTYTGAIHAGTYLARIRAVDNSGNLGDYGALSEPVQVDLVAPVLTYDPTTPIRIEGSPKLYPISTTLYYTNASQIARVDVGFQGSTTDTLSGPGTITASAAFNGFSTQPAFSSWENWVFAYSIPPQYNQNGNVVVTATDKAGLQSTLLFTYTYDGVPPYSGTVRINAGAPYATQTQVALDLTALDAGSGVAEMCVSNSSSCSAWESFAPTKTWSLDAVDGSQTVYAWFRDHLQNVTATPYTSTIFLDRAAPTSTTLAINSNAEVTSQALVTLTLDATDPAPGSGLADLRLSQDGVNWGSWTPYTTTVAYTLEATQDGLKTVYVEYRDRSGNVSAPTSKSILLDRQPPTGTITLKDGAAFTNQASVTLTDTVTDPIPSSGQLQMRFRNDDAAWEAWAPVVPTITWPLSATDGLRTVHAQFRDRAGNVSTADYSATIQLDTLPPTGTLQINHGARYTNRLTVTLSLSATDPGTPNSGPGAMLFSNDGLTWSEPIPYATSATWELSPTEGAQVVFAKLMDRALNPSGIFTASAFLDRVRPDTPVLTLPKHIYATQVTVHGYALDPGTVDINASGIDSYTLIYEDETGVKQTRLITELVVNATVPVTSEHTYTFTLTAFDKAGNFNSQSAILRVGLYRVYLPTVMNNYWACLRGLNDSFGMAEPLTLVQTAGEKRVTIASNFCSSDQADYYKITTTSEFLGLKLTAPANAPAMLTVYTATDTVNPPVAFGPISANLSASIVKAMAAGSYYLKITPVNAVTQAYAPAYSLVIADTPQPIKDGTFTQPLGNPWAGGTSPFLGHGRGLPQFTQIVVDGRTRARLGDPAFDASNNQIPVGAGYISQTFIVPAVLRKVQITYQVQSLDMMYGPTTRRYFDTFEVSLVPPDQVTDGDRNAKGCNTVDRINPTGELVVGAADHLLFCGGTFDSASPDNTGWRTVTLDLSSFNTGDSVTVYFAVWSREYDSPYYNDRGYYNTYAYVSDVKFIP